MAVDEMFCWVGQVASSAELRSLGASVCRRQFLLGIVGVAVPSCAGAAVPTMDDYLGREGGSKKKVSGYAVSGQKNQKGATGTEGGELLSADVLLGELEDAPEALAQIRELIKRQAWEDVRDVIKDRFRIAMLGRRGVRENALVFSEVFGRDNAEAETLMQELSATVRNLTDIALSNRVIFFNNVDRDQVSELSKTMEVDLDEPLQLTDDVEDIIEALRRTAKSQ